MSIPSLKKFICMNIEVVQNIEGLEKNNIIFFTPFGMVSGSPVITLENQNNAVKLLTTVTKSLTERYFEESEINEKDLESNDGYIILKDVAITSSGSNFNIPVLTLFYDQILGVTIGNRD